MFKAVYVLTGLVLPIVVPTSLALAQDASLQARGICGLYNHSGYLVVNEAGQLVNVTDYCQEQRQQHAAPETSAFWRAFEATASAEARAAAATLGSEQVVAYGSTICPFLDQGGTLQELRQIQLDGNLPKGFETAVTVAAIQTYCPAHQSELGR
jgi:hypothetical protein